MTTIDWRQRGREYADEAVKHYGNDLAGNARRLVRYWAARPGCDERDVRSRFADLLAAVRWTAISICGCESRGYTAEPCHSAAGREAEALRLLVEGFREKLTEIAEGK